MQWILVNTSSKKGFPKISKNSLFEFFFENVLKESMFARNTKMLFRIHCLSLSNSQFEMQKGPYLCYVSIFPDPPNHNGIDMRHGSQWWNRQFGCSTIHPTQKFTSMHLLQMPWVITRAWSFLTIEVVEVVRGPKQLYILKHTLAL